MNTIIYKPSTYPNHPSSLFPQISRCKTTRQLKQIHAHFIKTGQIHNPLAAAELLKFLTLSTQLEIKYARKFFSHIHHPNCFSWNTIIRALADSDDDDPFHVNPLEALLYFSHMLTDGLVEPNKFTFPCVLKACAKLARIEEGKQLHGIVAKLGLVTDEFVRSNLVRMYVMCGAMKDAHVLFYQTRLEGNVVLWNVMIDGFVRMGDLRASRELFDSMPNKSVVSWNVMISGYAQNGHFKEAIEMFHDMQLRDVSPNYVTLLSVLPAISRLGAIELGKWVHLFAEKNEIEIDDVLGSALIDMYSKSGSIDKAFQVFDGIRNKKNPITWSAIIGGLAMHGRARDALDHFWRMQQAGVTPSDVVAEAIHSMLEEMSNQLKSVGYRPNTTQVLLNVDEKEKQSALHYHSEKIAIAFGLISTRPQTPLRVVKNLRVCEDCHSSMKLVSKIYNRKIIVRDRKRFHHFENGSCSCMDYW
ncbi:PENTATRICOPEPTIDE REPEAT-CONTAINING PROTEIN [Salix viminalis]|uniref:PENTATRICOPEPTIDE REPEAT-CONTAINING PROTEIN n=1 Tax=Salix viminalis TaxID=40686 RepID=A0A9Q0SED3_SALVM|nr:PENTATRICOPEPTIDE REPEAT-CONTAINING PROTEIN [Salix viminalis]